MKKKLDIQGFPKSTLSLSKLINLTEKPFFSKSIKERVKNIGKPKYYGYRFTYHYDPVSNKIVLFVNLYFIIKGAKHKEKNKVKRNTYLVVIKVPYYKKIKNFRRLYNVPVQIFASDPSFKYYFAWVLHNLYGAVVLDEPEFVKHLGIALSKPPKVRNPDFIAQLTKHLFKIVTFLATQSPKKYLTPAYQIPTSKRITIDNEGNVVSV